MKEDDDEAEKEEEEDDDEGEGEECSLYSPPASLAKYFVHLTHLLLPKQGKGNFCKHSAQQSSRSHTGPIKNTTEGKKKKVQNLKLGFIRVRTVGACSVGSLPSSLLFLFIPGYQVLTQKAIETKSQSNIGA